MSEVMDRLAARRGLNDGATNLLLVAQVKDLTRAVIVQAETIRLQEQALRDLAGRLAGLEQEMGCRAVSDFEADDARDDAYAAAQYEGGAA